MKSSNTSTPYELDYLEELIRDFPCDKQIASIDAFNIIRVRYLELEKRLPIIQKQILQKPPAEGFKDTIEELISNNDYQPLHLYNLSIVLHKYLFDEILSNAGEFRKITDPFNGLVGFGGNHRRMPGNFTFNGTNPLLIRNDLVKTFQLLTITQTDPVRTSLEFYRQFVKVHPFYDANGRIGRFIVSAYLSTFGLYVKWRELEQRSMHNQFIKRLNECHKREGDENYPKYFNYLLQTFHKFVTKTTDFISDSEEF